MNKECNTTIKTIRNNLSFLQSSLDEAVTDAVIKINFVTQISVARYKSIIKQDYDYVVYPFTPDEINIILDNMLSWTIEKPIHICI